MVQARVIVALTLLGALLGGASAAFADRDYRAHAYVIRVPPVYGGKAGLALARSEPVLSRALRLARTGPRSVDWLRDRARVQLTGRLDFAISVRGPTRAEAIALATAYAMAIKRSLRPEPGLGTRGRGARAARRELGPVGPALIGGAAGLWLGAAVAIVRSGSGRARRRASAPCAHSTRATPG